MEIKETTKEKCKGIEAMESIIKICEKDELILYSGLSTPTMKETTKEIRVKTKGNSAIVKITGKYLYI